MEDGRKKHWEAMKKYYLERFKIDYEHDRSFFEKAVEKRIFNIVSSIIDDAINCFALELEEYGLKYAQLAEQYILKKMEIGDKEEEKYGSPHGIAYHNYYDLYLVRSLKENRWDYSNLRNCLDELYQLYDIKIYDTVDEFNSFVTFMILSSVEKKDIDKTDELFYRLNKNLSFNFPDKFKDKDVEKYGKSLRLAVHLLLQNLKGDFHSKEDLTRVFETLNEEVTKEWRLKDEDNSKEKRIARYYSITNHFDFQKVKNWYLYGIDEPREIARRIKGFDKL